MRQGDSVCELDARFVKWMNAREKSCAAESFRGRNSETVNVSFLFREQTFAASSPARLNYQMEESDAAAPGTPSFDMIGRSLSRGCERTTARLFVRRPDAVP